MEMTEAQRTKLDELIETLDRAKTLHSLKPKEAEALYISIYQDGELIFPPPPRE